MTCQIQVDADRGIVRELWNGDLTLDELLRVLDEIARKVRQHRELFAGWRWAWSARIRRCTP